CSVVDAYINGGEYIGGLTGMNYGTLRNCQVSGDVNGKLYTGGIVGYISSTGSTILNTSFNGNVKGENQTGGLVGYNYGTIEQCYANAIVDGLTQTGGLVGYHTTVSSGDGIRSSFYTGDVNGSDSVGGLVGRQYGKVYSCYSEANVNGISKAGGLVGESTGIVSGCYSTGTVNASQDFGGLAGFGDGENIFNSFWDIDTSGLLISSGGVGLTTSKMQSVSTYDFVWSCEVAQWTIEDGNDYPRLIWENQPGILIERYPYGGGSGTRDDPYLIYTAEQLNTIGLLECDWDSHFKLMADIDMAVLDGNNFNMIGYYDGSQFRFFNGVFDGNNHIIYNLIIEAESDDYVGMFGSTGSDCVIKNIELSDAYLDVNDCTYSAPLIGRNRGLIYACCSNADTVNGSSYIGGLVGYNDSYASIVNCYVSGSVEGQSSIGGMVGRNSGIIRRCYAATEINASQSSGGLVGYNTSNGIIEASFWDTDVSGELNGVGTGTEGDVTSKTTSQMQQSDTFLDAGWDFINEWTNGPSDIWAEPSSPGYMILWWQLEVLPELPTFSGGNGEPNNPYLIENASELSKIGHNPRLMGSNFLLVDDINLADVNFHFIGNEPHAFCGIFDGNGFQISNLNMQYEWEDYVGFFGYTDSNCIIKNLVLADFKVTTEKCLNVGGLAGLSNNTSIINCCFSGEITGSNIGYG
ncbi:MAG: GLUG motif-containing protein, partial [Candidatus Kariarchaeaceae archaeon]